MSQEKLSINYDYDDDDNDNVYDDLKIWSIF